MKTVILYAHPYEGSFNHAVLLEVEQLLKKQGKEVDVFDLNKDGFNPVMRKEDLKLFSTGWFADELAKSYAERLRTADELVIIFPIWWYGEPAILKGFYDKVFLKGWVYEEKEHGLAGLLQIKKTTILTTASVDRKALSYLGDPIENVLIKGILGLIGIENVEWIHCPTYFDENSRLEYLAAIKKHFN